MAISLSFHEECYNNNNNEKKKKIKNRFSQVDFLLNKYLALILKLIDDCNKKKYFFAFSILEYNKKKFHLVVLLLWKNKISADIIIIKFINHLFNISENFCTFKPTAMLIPYQINIIQYI